VRSRVIDDGVAGMMQLRVCKYIQMAKKTGMKQKIETISAVSLFGAILVASIGDES
jgi:hypothetical protein